MANDLLSALKTYLAKVGSGEKSPQELASALNHWAKESGEAIKTRIEEEVEKSVKRMGFAKKSDLDRLEREVAEMKKKLGLSAAASRGKKSTDSKKTGKVTTARSGARVGSKAKKSQPKAGRGGAK